MSSATQKITNRASACFRQKRSLYHYARGKMNWDPAYPFLARQLAGTNQPILDLGCGAGIFAAFLRESGCMPPIHGIDLDENKVILAQELVATKYTDITFKFENANTERNHSGSVVALDLLHYFSDEDQWLLLSHMVDWTGADGVLYIRNGVRNAGWRHWVTNAEEAFVRSSRWITGGAWNFPDSGEVETYLREQGMRVVTVPMWGGTPFSSTLFVAARS